MTKRTDETFDQDKGIGPFTVFCGNTQIGIAGGAYCTGDLFWELTDLQINRAAAREAAIAGHDPMDDQQLLPSSIAIGCKIGGDSWKLRGLTYLPQDGDQLDVTEETVFIPSARFRTFGESRGRWNPMQTAPIASMVELMCAGEWAGCHAMKPDLASPWQIKQLPHFLEGAKSRTEFSPPTHWRLHTSAFMTNRDAAIMQSEANTSVHRHYARLVRHKLEGLLLQNPTEWPMPELDDIVRIGFAGGPGDVTLTPLTAQGVALVKAYKTASTGAGLSASATADVTTDFETAAASMEAEIMARTSGATRGKAREA
jgi:hypothetical protein